MVSSISTKGQAWYMDFSIALLLFTLTLVIYFSYTNNFQKQESGGLDNMLSDSKAVSSSLILSGYPKGWDNGSVIRIGLADEQSLNATKLRHFKLLNYSKTKSSFGTNFDYFVFFINNDEVLNINGICGVGHQLITPNYNIKSAYYYSDEDDKVLKDFMGVTFDADIYLGDDGYDVSDIDGFISNLSKYTFIVLEHPDVSPSNFNKFQTAVENFSSRGGLAMISGQLTTSNDRDLLDVEFRKKAGQSLSDRKAIVNQSDDYLLLNVGQNITFSQAYYTENKSITSDFIAIATFEQDLRNAITKWKYGNGTNYFFSDFNVSYFNGDFAGLIEEAAKGMIGGTCNPINISQIKLKNLVNTERYLNYNSKLVKMIVYLWQ